MKRLLILLFTALFAQLVSSCYPEGADNIEDYDVAMTNYDTGIQFSSFSTFAIADTIVYFSDEKEPHPNHQFDEKIVELVTENFTARNYQQVDTNASPSFVVTISAFSNINYAYYVDNWYDRWGWYWGWWGGPFDIYYPWYPIGIYAYRTGTLVIDMISTTHRADNKINVVWSGIVDGLLQGSPKFIERRIEEQIRQCFDQSPYLKRTEDEK